MSDFETVARPYAKAIFELAAGSEPKEAVLQQWSDVLQLAAQIVQDESIQLLLTSPSVTRSQLTELFVSIMTSVEGAPAIDQDIKNLLAILAENNRLLALPAIAVGYEKLKQSAQGSVEVQG